MLFKKKSILIEYVIVHVTGRFVILIYLINLIHKYSTCKFALHTIFMTLVFYFDEYMLYQQTTTISYKRTALDIS